jgi:peptidyl-prolyl cis-trans isomerase B (cyclophilin B)
LSKKTHQRRIEQQRRARQAARQAERERQKRQLTVIITAIAVLAVVGITWAVVASVGGDESDAANTPTLPTTPPTTDPAKDPANKPKAIPTKLAPAPKRPAALPATVNCTYPKSTEPAAKKVNPPAAGQITTKGTVPVTLKTTAGDLKLTLDRSLAPCAVHNFLSLVQQKYYDKTKCHRMTVGDGLQVLQCGDPKGTGGGGPGYSFADEVWPQLKYGRGTLAMANGGKNTNGSQFFIVYGDASSLKPNYTAFGTVDATSLARIDTVARSGVNGANGPGDGQPNLPVSINTATTP